MALQIRLGEQSDLVIIRYPWATDNPANSPPPLLHLRICAYSQAEGKVTSAFVNTQKEGKVDEKDASVIKLRDLLKQKHIVRCAFSERKEIGRERSSKRKGTRSRKREAM